MLRNNISLECMVTSDYHKHYRVLIGRQGLTAWTLMIYVQAGVTKVTASKAGYAEEHWRHLMHLDQ